MGKRTNAQALAKHAARLLAKPCDADPDSMARALDAAAAAVNRAQWRSMSEERSALQTLWARWRGAHTDYPDTLYTRTQRLAGEMLKAAIIENGARRLPLDTPEIRAAELRQIEEIEEEERA